MEPMYFQYKNPRNSPVSTWETLFCQGSEVCFLAKLYICGALRGGYVSWVCMDTGGSGEGFSFQLLQAILLVCV